MAHYRVHQEQCNFEGGSPKGKCRCNCMNMEDQTFSQWYSPGIQCTQDQHCWGSMECESICDQLDHAPTRSLPGRQRRRQPSTPVRGRAYNKGGRVNTNSRFSGRTQSDHKGKPKK